MIGFQSIKKLIYIDTYGWVATASLLICIVSGIILAVPYDVGHPYLSVSLILIHNPAAAFTRNLHFWSAQSFLVFTSLHIYDHLRNENEQNIRKQGIWFRMTLSIAFTGYVMISGFILKADADSLQARRILSVLLNELPFVGDFIQQAFIGSEKNFQPLYIQHISTATIIILFVVYEHAHTIWTSKRTFLTTFIFLALLSWIFQAPLGNLNDPLMKGPWYFVGLQEILHWVSYPNILVSGSLLLLILIYFLPDFNLRIRRVSKYVLLSFLGFYIILTLIGFFFRGADWRWQWPWAGQSRIRTAFILHPVNIRSHEDVNVPVVNGQAESCLVCHSGMKGLSMPHSESNAGCYSCHLGDPFTLDKALAHRTMVRVPGNLSTAERTCGTANCHWQIVDRVSKNMMTSLTGIVGVDRFVFGENQTTDSKTKIQDISNSAADTHLRNLCAGCHLGNEKSQVGPASWLERGGGCNACHLQYSDAAVADLKYQKKKKLNDDRIPAIHPSIDLKISDEKCQSCHSRSGRISMNYEGWHETAFSNVPSDKTEKYRKLEDGRIFKFVQDDIHHEKGMACIDCHLSYELMGDGNEHLHKEEAVKIQCSDCHPKSKSIHYTEIIETDRETQLVAWLRNYQLKDQKILVTENNNYPLINMTVDKNGKIQLITKLDNRMLVSKPQAGACSEGNVHNRLNCETCHTPWAPQCLGCHNSYDKNVAGFDMLKNKSMKGSWIEYAGEYLADAPVLGVNTLKSKNGLIQTFVPGMILTIDRASFDKGKSSNFHRLYAPASAHTTQKGSRSCESCHNNPLAIGYGRGKLIFSAAGKWSFIPKYEKNKNDGLPEDAWTGFLRNSSLSSSTRKGIRSFNVEEQKRILTAGSCLTCHASDSKVMKESLYGLQAMIDRRTTRCIIPKW